MVIASLFLVVMAYIVISLYAITLTLETIEHYNGRVTRLDVFMTFLLSCIPLCNLGLILYAWTFSECWSVGDWWNKEV